MMGAVEIATVAERNFSLLNDQGMFQHRNKDYMKTEQASLNLKANLVQSTQTLRAGLRLSMLGVLNMC